ncbi:MAG: hypothetical protein ACI9ES_001774 [Oceanospirillaceae bacterium]|jgi:hypothetical protein
MSIIDFSVINKHTQLSFKAQRNMIKNIAKGATVLCQQCQKPLQLTTPIKGKKVTKTGVCCAKGCTDIELEFVP